MEFGAILQNETAVHGGYRPLHFALCWFGFTEFAGAVKRAAFLEKLNKVVRAVQPGTASSLLQCTVCTRMSVVQSAHSNKPTEDLRSNYED